MYMKIATVKLTCLICTNQSAPTVVYDQIKGDKHGMLRVVRCAAFDLTRGMLQNLSKEN
jgi:hypothetical protein